MQTVPSGGWIEVICGGMFSGKTEELLRRVRRARIARQAVQLFKPRLDVRYAEEWVVSHSDQRLVAEPVVDAAELLARVRPETRVVGVDEVQFLGAPVVAVLQTLADRGVRVICAGLDQDYRGRPFEPVPTLMAVAESVTKEQAICARCGGPACRSQRLVAQEGRLLLGGAEAYEPRCRGCFEPAPEWDDEPERAVVPQQSGLFGAVS